MLPLALPGLAAGSIFTFSLTLGDYIIPSVVGAPGYFIGMMVYQQQGTAGNMPLAAAFSVVPIVLIAIYLVAREAPRSLRCALGGDWNAPSLGQKLAAAAGLAFLHLPVLVIVLYAFTTEDRTYQFPPPGLTLHWFDGRLRARGHLGRDAAVARRRARRHGARARCSGRSRPSRSRSSRFRGQGVDHAAVRAADRAARHRHRHRAAGRHPQLAGIEPGFWTIVAGHATFCLVIVYNNVVARLRRLPRELDRGLDGPRRRRLPDLPLRAAAADRDARCSPAACWRSRCRSTRSSSRCSRPGHEQTLPIWFYNELFRPRERPITNVVAVIVILVTLVPILLAYYLTRPDEQRSA